MVERVFAHIYLESFHMVILTCLHKRILDESFFRYIIREIYRSFPIEKEAGYVAYDWTAHRRARADFRR